jgi:hypothetical protein
MWATTLGHSDRRRRTSQIPPCFPHAWPKLLGAALAMRIASDATKPGLPASLQGGLACRPWESVIPAQRIQWALKNVRFRRSTSPLIQPTARRSRNRVAWPQPAAGPLRGGAMPTRIRLPFQERSGRCARPGLMVLPLGRRDPTAQRRLGAPTKQSTTRVAGVTKGLLVRGFRGNPKTAKSVGRLGSRPWSLMQSRFAPHSVSIVYPVGADSKKNAVRRFCAGTKYFIWPLMTLTTLVRSRASRGLCHRGGHGIHVGRWALYCEARADGPSKSQNR